MVLAKPRSRAGLSVISHPCSACRTSDKSFPKVTALQVAAPIRTFRMLGEMESWPDSPGTAGVSGTIPIFRIN